MHIALSDQFFFSAVKAYRFLQRHHINFAHVVYYRNLSPSDCLNMVEDCIASAQKARQYRYRQKILMW